jgi:hypothetical protein
MADTNGNLDRKFEFIAEAMARLDVKMDKLAKAQDLLARSTRLREGNTRLLEESTRPLARVDRLWKVVRRRDRYRRAGTSLRDFLLWEDAT